MAYDDGTDDSGFVLPDEIREPDWTTDDQGSGAGADASDSDFMPPDEIREPDWTS